MESEAFSGHARCGRQASRDNQFIEAKDLKGHYR